MQVTVSCLFWESCFGKAGTVEGRFCFSDNCVAGLNSKLRCATGLCVPDSLRQTFHYRHITEVQLIHQKAKVRGEERRGWAAGANSADDRCPYQTLQCHWHAIGDVTSLLLLITVYTWERERGGWEAGIEVWCLCKLQLVCEWLLGLQQIC